MSYHQAKGAVRKTSRKLSRFYHSLRAVVQHGIPNCLLFFAGGIGDDLLCTAVLREMRLRELSRPWMMSDYPELFGGNTDVARVIPRDFWVQWWLERNTKTRVIHPSYAPLVAAEGRQIPVRRHIIAAMCEMVGITGPVTLRPYLTLSDEERAWGRIAPRQIVIQSSGASARMRIPEKEWYPERFQQVVTALRSRYTFIQVGARTDPPLQGATDLRGETSLRETAAILSNALVCVTLEGFLMHMARAVDCRSVVIYGGRLLPSQIGYACNENLWVEMPCGPCWRVGSCPYDRACMAQITPDHAVTAIERQVERAARGLPLPTDQDTLAPTEGSEAAG